MSHYDSFIANSFTYYSETSVVLCQSLPRVSMCSLAFILREVMLVQRLSGLRLLSIRSLSAAIADVQLVGTKAARGVRLMGLKAG